MSINSYYQIEKEISEYLTPGEKLVSVAVLKEIPAIYKLMLTRGFAGLFSQLYIMGITGKRIVLLPINQKGEIDKSKIPDYIEFKDVEIQDKFIFNPMFHIQINRKDKLLDLRFASGFKSINLHKYEFISAFFNSKSSLKNE
ncbi:MAG: hypothetical protein MUO34_09540 [Ignavibacteriaceae bacterium]|nr:hypothetical protein [Ignavibacteriaceae bacterium]